MMIEQRTADSMKIERLRKRINSQSYVHAAIQRIATVLSNRLIDMAHGEGTNERQRKRGRF